MAIARGVWSGLLVLAMLAALGLALSIIVARINRSSADTLTLKSSVLQASGDKLGLWQDQAKTQPVTSLEFRKLQVQPPLRPLGPGPQATVFIENMTTGDLYLVQPCGDVESPPGTRIGTMDTEVRTLGGDVFGNTCDVPVMAPGQLLKAELKIELVPDLETGDYPFQTVFEAVSAIALPTPDGLVSWWPAAGDAIDVIDGNNGALVGGADYAPGLVGQAFSLDGDGDYIDLGDISSFDFSDTDFTIDAWFKIPDYPANAGGGCGSQYPIFRNNAWGYGAGIYGNGHLSFGKYLAESDSVEVSSSGPLSTGDWHHFAAVHTLSQLRLYIDGQLSNTSDSPNGTIYYHPVGFDTPEIGRWLCGDLPYFYFKGLIDEVGIFDRALTDAEIEAIHEAGGAGSVKPPPPKAAILPGDAVNWWWADENAMDSIGSLNGNHNGSYGPGVVGQAFSFNGSGQYIDLGDVPDLDFTNEDFSTEGWFRIPHLPDNAAACGARYPIFHNRDWGYGTQIYGDGLVNFYKYYSVSAAVGVTSPSPISVGDWHHFASVHTVSELRLYLDGQLVNTADSPSGAVFYQSSDQPEIGRMLCGPSFFHFKGLIDELTVYSRALTEAEIASIHDARYAGKVAPPP